MKNNRDELTPVEIITILGGGQNIVIEDRSNDPQYAAEQREALKKAGIKGRWKVIKPINNEE